jgi:hypothetical protein
VKVLMTVAAVVTGVLGVAWLFFPQPLLASWGAHGDAVALYMGRRYGAMFFGYSLVMWLGRTAASLEARRVVLAGGAVATIVLAAVSVLGAVTGVVGPTVWAAAIVETGLTVGFGYYWITARGSAVEGEI